MKTALWALSVVVLGAAGLLFLLVPSATHTLVLWLVIGWVATYAALLFQYRSYL